MSIDVTGLGAVSELAGAVISRIWPDKSAAEQQQLAAAVLIVQGQLDINKVEASSPSVFVSGWRPFIGWVCGWACAWNWIGISLVSTICTIINHPVALQKADVAEMMPVLLGLLGLGALRTFEKVKGAT